jgi:hypothetical protein
MAFLLVVVLRELFDLLLAGHSSSRCCRQWVLKGHTRHHCYRCHCRYRLVLQPVFHSARQVGQQDPSLVVASQTHLDFVMEVDLAEM